MLSETERIEHFQDAHLRQARGRATLLYLIVPKLSNLSRRAN
jgi:hypothetical protein